MAGLNAQLRLVRRGQLRVTLGRFVSWLETHANPTLVTYDVHLNLASFQPTASGYCQFGLIACAVEYQNLPSSIEGQDGLLQPEQQRPW